MSARFDFDTKGRPLDQRAADELLRLTAPRPQPSRWLLDALRRIAAGERPDVVLGYATRRGAPKTSRPWLMALEYLMRTERGQSPSRAKELAAQRWSREPGTVEQSHARHGRSVRAWWEHHVAIFPGADRRGLAQDVLRAIRRWQRPT
jgi:hypothetical protein